ncbi:hypothetical protein [Paraburkholderia youngii]|uniref:Uncharacterized protein n=1 Tax=Paraburkholderia youngii TaxID=2782701 RepID=A0A7Y6K7F7_9BURK|nr:hypothetical protein [Paraburkholderia youngii]NUY05786.1 hypothetical protein [Paraburkholderia youngii]
MDQHAGQVTVEPIAVDAHAYLNGYNQNRPDARLADQTLDEAYFATLPAIKSAA